MGWIDTYRQALAEPMVTPRDLDETTINWLKIGTVVALVIVIALSALIAIACLSTGFLGVISLVGIAPGSAVYTVGAVAAFVFAAAIGLLYLTLREEKKPKGFLVPDGDRVSICSRNSGVGSCGVS